MTTAAKPGPSWSTTGRLLALIAGYSISAWFCLEMARHPGSIAAIWYPNAFALCFIAIAGQHARPLLLLTIALNNLAVNLLTGTSIGMALGFAIGNTTEVWLGTVLLNQLGSPRQIAHQPLRLLKLLMLLIGLGSGIGAVLGTVVLGLAGAPQLGQVFQLWWIGDAIGMASIVPLGIIAVAADTDYWRARHRLLATAAYALYGTAAVALSFVYLPFPYIYVAALLVGLGVFAGLTALAVAAAAASVTMTALIAYDLLQPAPGTAKLLFYLPMLISMVLPVVLAAYVTRSQLDNKQLGKLTAARKEQADQLRAVLAAMPDGLLVVSADGWIKNGNAAASRLFGYPAMALMGMPLTRLFPPELQTPTPSHQLDLASRVGQRQECLGLDAGGNALVLEMATERTRRNGDEWFVLMLRDISEAKKIARMKSQFVATVSHELRTPLTAITGAVEVLANGGFGPLNAPATELLDIARRNGQRLKVLVDDLLDMEKLAAGKLVLQLNEQDVRPLILNVCQTNQPLGLRKQVQLQAKMADAPLCARVDGSRLQQVLTNLVANAIKFAPDNSEVALSARRDGDAIEIAVRDHGPGIPETFRPRLFEQFAQADGSDKRQYAGTGLGLAISKALTEQMRGQIGYRQPAEHGAEFFVRLPATSAPDD